MSKEIVGTTKVINDDTTLDAIQKISGFDNRYTKDIYIEIKKQYEAYNNHKTLLQVVIISHLSREFINKMLCKVKDMCLKYHFSHRYFDSIEKPKPSNKENQTLINQRQLIELFIKNEILNDQFANNINCKTHNLI